VAVSVVDPDSVLVQEHLGGEREAFDLLYRRYFPKLVRLCARLTKDSAAAEDIAQETLVRAHEHLARFDLSRPMWPWLKTIATRLLIDHARVRARELPVEHGRTLNSHDAEPGWNEERDVLAEALSKLPPRQQTAVALRYLEDWDGPQAAEFLGLSGLAFRQILHRAKRKLHTEYKKIAEPAWGAMLVPFGWIRRMSHEAVARIRPNASGLEATKVIASFAALNLAVAGVAIFGRAGHDAPPSVREPARPNSIARASASPLTQEDGSRHPVRASSQDRAMAQTPSAPVVEQEPPGSTLATEAEDRGKDIAQDFTDPTGEATEPEDTNIVWIEHSPRFGSDGTVYAAGVTVCQAHPCPRVLFRSTDAGAGWERLAADGLDGSQILLPPAFGAGDDRIFALGPLGLQVSNDGGASFQSAAVGVSGGAGSAAISPGFNTTDPTILIGDQSLMEYRDDVRAVGPTTPVPGRGPLHPAFSPAYETDGLVLVGGLQVDATQGGWASSVFRCSGKVCSGTPLATRTEPPRVRLAPDYEETGLVYAFTSQGLFVSSDRALSFSQLTVPWRDLLREVSPAEGGLVFAVARGTAIDSVGEFYVSPDAGVTWTRVSDPTLSTGVASVRVSGQHVLVSLQAGGLACSADGGQTWAARCPAS